ncbi:DUF6745 domain-containing protein [Limnofasciculus baicalensis]|uniref:DUF6745 domain-containing protein n=1 Tax=Limnofasciculus baicalensis BBK-W-15 TaxID=2699891 RepID=A0AAE3KPZ4_9CYAN|nr:hypothetical protein [Limnofasciculus baicalensis]MCP2732030.1 hypothetical protein [Limnofasciculus baicalensis BBK-W-15]
MSQIEQLTPEQEALIPVYREKWRAIALSTEPINRAQATEAVNAAYRWIWRSQQEPELLFFPSPYAALSYIGRELQSQADSQLTIELRERVETDIDPRDNPDSILRRVMEWNMEDLYKELEHELKWRLWDDLGNSPASQTGSQLESLLEAELRQQLGDDLSSKLSDCLENILSGGDFGGVQPEIFASDASLLDFGLSVLGCCPSLQEDWLDFQLMIKDCGWIFPFDDICLVCDRPLILSFDHQQRLHAEATPAIEFPDGFTVYAYHGAILPEKYGKLYPQEWQAEWLLTEENAELRRVLIQGIGWDGICQKLPATELDSWQDYTLLKINSDLDIEPICLLKMICPSTGYIHALRVPPDVESARDAIIWINWGILPEEFAVQT